MGGKGPRISMSSGRWTVTSQYLLLMIDTKRELTDNGVTLLATDTISPRALLNQINVWVLETYHTEWKRIANEALDPPRYTIGFCRTKQCSNAAFLFELCPTCCRNRWKVEVRETTDVIDGHPAGGLGLFATRDWEGGGERIHLQRYDRHSSGT